jgi:CheY-like chemotaxis protein
VAKASEFLPQIAFLDIGMPKLNGYDLARRLRELPGLQECVLVAVTGWGKARTGVAHRRPASTTTWSSRSSASR